MALKLYNTLTRQKAGFEPIDPKNVRMYVCGPTVYDFAHIGNARPVIVFDVLFRLLRQLYGDKHVTYVRNITDVDDKINARALRDFPALPLNAAIAHVTEKTTNQFHADVKALGCLEPTVEPRATDNIAEMIAMIEQLLAKGHAYQAAGEVLFDTSSMADYGALSNRNLDEQQAGARVDVEAHKKNPGDFVLWKLSSAEEPGWDSPWGRGRPGWHIECSAMSARYLGNVFDIHGGGLDLIFPHHENEIAQSRCAHGTDVMANVWMHNGFLQVEGEKMSKSLGNFVTINELLAGWRGYAWPGQVVRFAMLMTHYRQPLDFSQNALEQADIALDGFKSLPYADSSVLPSQEFLAAMNDDLNTPRAIAELHRLFNEARNASIDLSDRMGWPGEMISDGDFSAASQMAAGLRFLGVDLENHQVGWADKQQKSKRGDEGRIVELITARLAARKAKDFAESDRIREELAGMGIALKDSKDPATGEIVTTWEVARSPGTA